VKLVATVGTTGSFPRFTRLLAEVAAARPDVELVFQAGRGPLPEVRGAVAFLPRDALLAHMATATLIVCHGGSGSLRDALRACGNVAVVPRRAGTEEGVVDDHQRDLALALEARGLVRVVSCAADVLARLEAPRAPRMTSENALTRAVVATLDGLMGAPSRGARRGGRLP
jgi:UDP-N-acetylglucosamine transferase subunit ALG13